MNLQSIIEFLKTIEQFKTCERTCHTTNPSRAESDAEHTWHLVTFLLLLEDEFKSMDFVKLLKLAAVHDLPEIFAGDTNPYRGDTSNKEENEREAAERLFSTLPAPLKERFHDLFDEYLKQETPEAKIVKSADKLLPLIQNLCSNKDYSSYRKLQVQYPEVKEYMDGYFTDKGVLKDLYEILLDEANKSGVFYKEPNQ